MISKDSVIIRQYKNSLKINTEALLTSVVKKEEVKILDVHRDQLRRGEFGDGKSPTYGPGYLNYKESKSSYFASPYTDLYDTGSFQQSEYLRLSGNQWEIDSRDGKTTKLLNKYGEVIFDLNANSLTLAQEIVTPEFLKIYHTELNK